MRLPCAKNGQALLAQHSARIVECLEIKAAPEVTNSDLQVEPLGDFIVQRSSPP